MPPLTEYQNTPIRDVVQESTPSRPDSDVLVFLMGPYRLLDPTYLYPSRTVTELPPDPLAPNPSRDDASPDEIEATLRRICQQLSERTHTTAFIASEVDVPTKRQVARNDLDEPGMTVLDQSIAFAAASDGCAFVFTRAGLTTGVGTEAGAIPEFFDLCSPERRTRSPKQFCIFEEATHTGDTYEPTFGSASIDEMDLTYDLRFRYFADQQDLVDSLTTFVESYVVPLSG